MNERVMQFRIGMFVIMAGLVLTMMIVWFGESPSLFRDQVYVIAHYTEAPGVSEGIPVRKSGIRVGEVRSIRFDDRPGMPDGVLVLLALERKYKIRAGSVPRITRALIGDVSIDLLPGTDEGYLPVDKNPTHAPVIEGEVAPDPAKALEAATAAFQRVGGTLGSIDKAADGIASLTKKAENLDKFLDTWQATGGKVDALATDLDRVVKASELDFVPTVKNLREVSERLNGLLDADSQTKLRASIDRLSTASTKFDAILTDLQPLSKDLGAPAGGRPTTTLGQTLARFNRISFEIGLLTRALDDGRGRLNPNGSVQKLMTNSELTDNLNQMAIAMRETFNTARPVLKSLGTFADKIAQRPSVLTEGAPRPR